MQSVDTGVRIASGGRAGFCKALSREWPETQVRIIDVDSQLSQQEALNAIIKELCIEDPTLETFIEQDDRMQLELLPLPTPSPLKQEKPESTMHIICTGGGRGIGRATAAQFCDEGATVIIAEYDEKIGRKAANEIGCNYFYVANILEGLKLRKSFNSNKISIAIFEGYLEGNQKFYAYANGRCKSNSCIY